jgi:molybdenum cofactor synthesis domain-containing protein
MIPARVITCSDAAACGEREDRSGAALRDLLNAHGYTVDAVVIVADTIEFISTAITDATEAGNRLVVTTGGTGIAPRDVTPEATLRVGEKIIPGFGEVMRASSLQKTPMAALSRTQAVTRGAALVVNVPGNERAAVENLEAVLHLIPHALELLSGNTEH